MAFDKNICLLIVAGALGSCAPLGPRPAGPTEAPASHPGSEWSRPVHGAPPGARTAADLLRCCVRSHHLFGIGVPASDRAAVERPAPLLVVDGLPVSGLRWLEDMPAGQVERIRVLSPARGVALFGSRAGRGAIVVDTRRGGRSPAGRRGGSGAGQ